MTLRFFGKSAALGFHAKSRKIFMIFLTLCSLKFADFLIFFQQVWLKFSSNSNISLTVWLQICNQSDKVHWQFDCKFTIKVTRPIDSLTWKCHIGLNCFKLKVNWVVSLVKTCMSLSSETDSEVWQFDCKLSVKVSMGYVSLNANLQSKCQQGMLVWL